MNPGRSFGPIHRPSAGPPHDVDLVRPASARTVRRGRTVERRGHEHGLPGDCTPQPRHRRGGGVVVHSLSTAGNTAPAAGSRRREATRERRLLKNCGVSCCRASRARTSIDGRLVELDLDGVAIGRVVECVRPGFSRDIIGRAEAMLMQRYDIDAVRAFDGCCYRCEALGARPRLRDHPLRHVPRRRFHPRSAGWRARGGPRRRVRRGELTPACNMAIDGGPEREYPIQLRSGRRPGCSCVELCDVAGRNFEAEYSRGPPCLRSACSQFESRSSSGTMSDDSTPNPRSTSCVVEIAISDSGPRNNVVALPTADVEHLVNSALGLHPLAVELHDRLRAHGVGPSVDRDLVCPHGRHGPLRIAAPTANLASCRGRFGRDDIDTTHRRCPHPQPRPCEAPTPRGKCGQDRGGCPRLLGRSRRPPSRVGRCRILDHLAASRCGPVLRLATRRSAMGR